MFIGKLLDYIFNPLAKNGTAVWKYYRIACIIEFSRNEFHFGYGYY